MDNSATESQLPKDKTRRLPNLLNRSRKPEMSRRNFLKTGAQASVAGALSSSELSKVAGQLEQFAQGIDKREIREEEPHTVTDNVTYIDILSDYDHEQFAVNHIGEGYRDFSIQLNQAQDRDQFIAEALTNEETASFALMYLYTDQYQHMQGSIVYTEGTESFIGHDQLVTETSQFLYDQAGWNVGKPNVIPLQDNVSSIVQVETRDGLPALEITVDADLIIDSLKNNNSPIINMSFQVGKFRFGLEDHVERSAVNFYPVPFSEVEEEYFTLEDFEDVEYPMLMFNDNDQIVDSQGDVVPPDQIPRPKPYNIINGEKQYLPLYTREQAEAEGIELQDEFIKPDTEIKEAYSEEFALESFQELIKVCKAYPDKLFVNSSGNFNSFSGEQRVQLESEWPDNLILTGFGPVNTKPVGEEPDYFWTYGNNISDIYIDYSFMQSSSESAAVISALASVIKEKNPDFSATEIRTVILEEITYSKEVYGKNLKWLDLEKMNEYLQA